MHHWHVRKLTHIPWPVVRTEEHTLFGRCSMQFNWFCTFLLSLFTFFDYIYGRYNLCYSVLNKVNKWIRINSAWIRIKIVYWINSNKSDITLYRRVITFGNVPSNYNNYLASERGKFKLAKQQDSSIRPTVPFKRLNSCQAWFKWWYSSVKRMRFIPWHFNSFI